jgi:hypothetical protein
MTLKANVLHFKQFDIFLIEPRTNPQLESISTDSKIKLYIFSQYREYLTDLLIVYVISL